MAAISFAEIADRTRPAEVVLFESARMLAMRCDIRASCTQFATSEASRLDSNNDKKNFK
jgi:hypothetical protein